MNRYFYIVIPTCNGEIMDDPYLYTSNGIASHSNIVDELFDGYKEVTIYRIDTKTYELLEVE